MNTLAKKILSLCHNVQVTTDRAGIENAFVQHCRKLFGKPYKLFNSEKLEHLLTRLPKLSESDRKGLDEAISLEEIQDVIDPLQSHKYPCPGGIALLSSLGMLGTGFYKSKGKRVCPILLRLFKLAYDVNYLTRSFESPI